MKLLLLDRHPYFDARLERHMGSLVKHDIETLRIRVSRCEDSNNLVDMSNEAVKTVSLKPILNSHGVFHQTIQNLIYLLPSLFFHHYSLKNFIPNESEMVIHVHDPELIGIANKIKRKRGPNCKIVYDRHEVFEEAGGLYGKIARLHEIRNAKNIDAVIGVSTHHELSNRGLFSNAIVNTVPNYPVWSDYDHGKILEKIDSFDFDTPILLTYVGSLNQDYDRDILFTLDVMEYVLEQCSRTIARVAGRSPNETVSERFRFLENKYGDRFRYLGFISREDSRILTERSHVGFFILKTDSKYYVKSSPNKFFEYLITGNVAVVRADLDFNASGSAALLFNKGDSQESVIQSLIDLVNDPDSMRLLMINAREEGSKRTYESVEGVYLDVYKKLGFL